MELVILLIVCTLLGVSVYTLLRDVKIKQHPQQNQVELEKKLETAFNQIVVTIIEKNAQETARIRESQLTQAGKLEKDIQSQFHTLTQQILEKNHTNSQSLKESISKALQESSLSLLSQSKVELSKIQDSNKESIQNLITLSKDKLSQINSDVQKRLDENFARNIKSFEEVTKNLGQIEQKAQHMIESTKSIDKLNSIFGRTSSKAFGTFAENYLESMLTKYLEPSSWAAQVPIVGSNDKIDFVLYFAEKQIGIDSKFPLTKYNDFINEDDQALQVTKRKEYIRSVRDMAKSISSKYLSSHQLDTLLLYLPSDSMYLECLHEGENFMDTIHSYGVSLISPNTLFPQLVLIQNYQSQIKIAQNADTIIKGLSNIQKNMNAFRTEYLKLGDKLRHAQNNYDSAQKSLESVNRNISLLQSGDEKQELL